LDRRDQFITAWRKLAAGSSFAGKTLDEFIEATKRPEEVRESIATAKATLKALNQERKQADTALRDLLALVLNAVKGDLLFGENSPLYKAFGFVPKDDRKSGLTRKGNKTKDANAA
jgi:hypothetical protein